MEVIKSTDDVSFEAQLIGKPYKAIGRLLRRELDLEFSIAVSGFAGFDEVHGVVAQAVTSVYSIACVHRGDAREAGVIPGHDLAWSMPAGTAGLGDLDGPESLIPLWQALLQAVADGRVVTPNADNDLPGDYLVGTTKVVSSKSPHDLVFSVEGDPDNFDADCRYEAKIDPADHSMRWEVVHQCGSPMEAMPNVDGWAVFDGRVALTSWSSGDFAVPAWLCLRTKGPGLPGDDTARLDWMAAWGHAMFVAGGLDSEAQLDRTGN